jgi:hypothetical protein
MLTAAPRVASQHVEAYPPPLYNTPESRRLRNLHAEEGADGAHPTRAASHEGSRGRDAVAGRGTDAAWRWPEEHWRQAVNKVRAGRSLTPATWPNSASGWHTTLPGGVRQQP